MLKTITNPEGELDLHCTECEYSLVSAWPTSPDLWQADHNGKTFEGTKSEVLALMASVTCQDCEA